MTTCTSCRTNYHFFWESPTPGRIKVEDAIRMRSTLIRSTSRVSGTEIDGLVEQWIRMLCYNAQRVLTYEKNTIPV
jgi:hypothetical protein